MNATVTAIENIFTTAYANAIASISDAMNQVAGLTNDMVENIELETAFLFQKALNTCLSYANKGEGELGVKMGLGTLKAYLPEVLERLEISAAPAVVETSAPVAPVAKVPTVPAELIDQCDAPALAPAPKLTKKEKIAQAAEELNCSTDDATIIVAGDNFDLKQLVRRELALIAPVKEMRKIFRLEETVYVFKTTAIAVRAAARLGSALLARDLGLSDTSRFAIEA